MSVRITSYAPTVSGGTVTSGALTLFSPNFTGTIGAQLPVDISSVTGLQAVLDSKFDIDGSDALDGDLQVNGNELWLSPLGDAHLVAPDEQTVQIWTNSVPGLIVTDTAIDVSTKPIQNVVDPTDPQDAATRNYVDVAISGAASAITSVFGRTGAVIGEASDYDANQIDFTPVGDIVATDVQAAIAELDTEKLSLAGGTMTGDIGMGGLNFLLDADSDSAISAAVDDEMLIVLGGSAAMNLSQTELNLFNSAIVNVADPTDPQDAATKNYTDATFVPASGGTFTGLVEAEDGVSFGTSGLNTIGSGGAFFEIQCNADEFGNYLTNGFANRIVLGSAASSGISLFTAASGLAGSSISYVNNLSLFPSRNETFVPMRFANGTPAVPSVSFNSDSDSGLFLINDGIIGFSIGGINQISLSSGQVDFQGGSLINVADPTGGDEVGDRDYNDARYVQIGNDLSEVNAASARTNLGLATVAASGDYNDLINVPSLVVSLNDVADVNTGVPGAGEDGFVLQWSNGAGEFVLGAETVTSVFGRTGTVISVAGDYDAGQIDFTPVGDIAATDVQAALAEVDAEKLALAGGVMSGSINMGGNDITNVGTFGIGDHVFGTDYTSAQAGNSFLIRTTSTPGVATPTYSFNGADDSGMRWTGTDIAFSVAGATEMVIESGTINMRANTVSNVADPVAAQDAVTLGFFENRGCVHILGSATVDLTTAGTSAIYTVPVGRNHVVTKIVVVASTYTPGVGPTDPVVSLGSNGPPANDLVDTWNISWGGTSGSADQAVHVDPDQAMVTPNSGDTVSITVATPAGGTFSALDATIYILGFEV